MIKFIDGIKENLTDYTYKKICNYKNMIVINDNIIKLSYEIKYIFSILFL